MSRQCKTLAAICLFGLIVGVALPALAQSEVKEKSPMYCYVSEWAIPRTQWAEMGKSDGADQPLLQKAMSDGLLVGYGSDVNLVHQADGATHDDWWCSSSMSGVLNVLDQFYKSGSTTSPALESATKHWDNILVSRYYNWHPGTMKAGYTHGAMYKLKADAPGDAIDTLAKSVMVPRLEKMLANGTIIEYEIDTEAIHTSAPGAFFVFYLTPNAEGIDKMNDSLRDTVKNNPLILPAFDLATESSAHRDYLDRTNATYK
jgi:hypothetical protein